MRLKTEIITIIGCLALAAVITDDLPFKPAKAQTEAASHLQCKSLSSVLDTMVQSRIGVVATGVMSIRGLTADVMLVRSQSDGSWMLLGTNVASDEACLLLGGPSLTVAPTA